MNRPTMHIYSFKQTFPRKNGKMIHDLPIQLHLILYNLFKSIIKFLLQQGWNNASLQNQYSTFILRINFIKYQILLIVYIRIHGNRYITISK